jgi:hypothetical protein
MVAYHDSDQRVGPDPILQEADCINAALKDPVPKTIYIHGTHISIDGVPSVVMTEGSDGPMTFVGQLLLHVRPRNMANGKCCSAHERSPDLMLSQC